MTGDRDSHGVLVTVRETRGSAPRDQGTMMWVTGDGAEKKP